MVLFVVGYGVMFMMFDDFWDKYGISVSLFGLVVVMGFFFLFLV